MIACGAAVDVTILLQYFKLFIFTAVKKKYNFRRDFRHLHHPGSREHLENL